MSLLFLAFALTLSTIAMIWRFGAGRRLSVVTVTFWTLFALHGASAIPYALDLLHRAEFAHTPVPESFPLVIGLSFLCYTAGALAVPAVLRLSVTRAQSQFFATPTGAGRLRFALFAILSVAAVLVALLYLFGAGATGLTLLRPGADATLLREHRAGFSEANPYTYVAALAMNAVLPVLMLTALNRAAAVTSWKWRWVGISLFVVLLAMSAAGLHKAPIVVAFLYVVINSYYSGHFRRVSLPKTALAGAILVVGLGSLGYCLTYDIGPIEALSWTLHRIAVAPQNSLEAFLQVYPKRAEFNYGTGIGLVARLLGDNTYVSPPLLVGSLVTGRSDVSLNAFWASEAWAAAGYVGVIGASFCVGAGLALADRACLRSAKSDTCVALYAVWTVSSVSIASVSILTVLLSGGFVLAAVVASLLGWTARHRRRRMPLPSGFGAKACQL
ncbi:hypothetical protein [Anaeromyxobacter sp. PSR-1]|uniref:hypothetical protein n=1 Tax=Anaeromyxobacter sp. PSR-1 TaxID=1300915 RepID=UPI0005E2AB91|nr:hypothetical protein [Anaeromyxobacter sp. PSR-1]GAO01356.1 hypothetical protein PSR1_00210 [Anaeromyxobacter sp. PSR-1]